MLSKEKPIIFSTPMVQTILAGRKTMTRRVIKPQPPENYTWTGWIMDSTESSDIGCCGWEHPHKSIIHHYSKPKYQVGDILWVRETWTKLCRVDENGYTHYDEETIYYAADGSLNIDLYDADGFLLEDQSIKWKPSIHMPRKAARLFLKVKDIRVERLQDITEEDAQDEGVKDPYDYQHPDYYEQFNLRGVEINKCAFAGLWDSINLKRGYPFASNPWVWVVEFERVEAPK